MCEPLFMDLTSRLDERWALRRFWTVSDSLIFKLTAIIMEPPAVPPPCGCLFTFYSNSPKGPPGIAPGETLCPTHTIDITPYSTLLINPSWRLHLSNFHYTQLPYRNRTYPSLEHAYQTTKAAIMTRGPAAEVTDEEFERFEKLTVAKVKSVGGKIQGKITEWDRVRRGIMTELLDIKYGRQGTERDVLLGTGTAVLRHILPGREHDDVGRLGAALMRIRDAGLNGM
ncbi:hypothetical protein HK097_007983 [Rhizophlyctis rosea]|uniref:NADAR domain-containing protein n=1 Tax=Rhizophlyctis rosea TaxID=64517 RepID=A0AAD5X1B5_9FUNG|nr:hypothetical protein HK097_007983 [Rhizophlyctis rosea]